MLKLAFACVNERWLVNFPTETGWFVRVFALCGDDMHIQLYYA